MSARAELSFGVVCRGASLKWWQAEAIERLRRAGARPVIAVLRPLSAAWPGGGAEQALFCAYRRATAGRGAERPVDLAAALDGVPAIDFPASPATGNDLAPLREARLDFILAFGSRDIAEGLLGIARHGVWSFRHDDEDDLFGRPPGFWEVFSGSDVTEAVLHRLGDAPGTAALLRKGVFKTLNTYPQNVASIGRGVASWPAHVCADIARGACDYLVAPPARVPPPAEGPPTRRDLTRFLVRSAVRTATAAGRRALLQEEWNVGIVDAPIDSFLQSRSRPRVHWLPPGIPGSFYADPFGIVDGERVHVICEEFDSRLGRGVIVTRTVDPGEGGLGPPVRRVLDLGVHISYPFLICHDSEIYGIPETYDAGDLALYRVDPLLQSWVRVATLFKDFPYVDSTVAHHAGRFWLWAAEVVRPGPCTKLFVWHATDLRGPWTPHERNPVLTDVRVARPGGTPFVVDGQLYRPAQDGSKTYGGRISIQRVTKLAPDAYEEEPAAVVEPDPHGPYPDGLHTLSAIGRRTLIDGKRIRLVSYHDIRRKFGRLFGR